MTDDELQQLPKELRDQLKTDRNAGMATPAWSVAAKTTTGEWNDV